ncbi:hypothetical protein GQ457_09G018760 [Hibiscus cannabinus]
MSLKAMEKSFWGTSIYHQGKKLGHIKFDCPQLKKKSSGYKKQKAHVATWSDKDSSDEEEQEVANLCLMALKDDLKVTSNSSTFEFNFDGLQEAYYELQEVYDDLVMKYKESVFKTATVLTLSK